MKCVCGYQFVFDPKTPPYISDRGLHGLIQTASSLNTRYFTLDSLYGTMKRKFQGKPSAWHWLAIVTMVLIALIMDVVIFWAAAVIYLIVVITKIKKAKDMGFEDLQLVMKKWQQSELKSEFYLDKPSLHSPPPNYNEKDIYDYGVEKIILVDNDLTVDYLVKNNEHVNAKALIISSLGYPNYLQNVCKQIVTEQTDVPVLLFHSVNVNKLNMTSEFQKNTGIEFKSDNVHDVAINQQQLKHKKLVKGLAQKDLARLTVEMLPFAAVAMVCAMGIGALAQFAQAGDRGFESSFDDFG